MADGDNLIVGQSNSADATTRLSRGGAISRAALIVENGSGDGIHSRGSGNETGVQADSDSGAGVFARSISGWGLLGVSSTHTLLTPPPAAVAGIAGGDPGTATPAVYARSERGYAVEAAATERAAVYARSEHGYAVEASATDTAAVYAVSTAPAAPALLAVNQEDIGIGARGRLAVSAIGADEDSGGVYATGTHYGVWGLGITGPGVDGYSDQSFGVRGRSDQSAGVRGESNQGVGAVGRSTHSFGLLGQSASGSQSASVLGFSSGVEAGVEGHSPGGPAVVGTTAAGSAASFVGPVFIWGSLFVIGATKSAVVPHPDGTLRQLYCMESPESWFEDFGTGELNEGEANVSIDPDFATLVQADDYHVFLTPYDDCNGLYVSRRRPDGFQVREQRGGQSSLQFSYRLLSRRRDVEAPRLKPVTPPPRPEPPTLPADREPPSARPPTPTHLRRGS
jgi:hypothetical protein